MHFTMLLSHALVCTVFIFSATAYPTSSTQQDTVLLSRATSNATTSEAQISLLFSGNRQFMTNIKESDPDLLLKLTKEGQHPPFMFLGCSDSRVSENQVFDAKPGTLFTHRNIANQFSVSDPNANSVLAYAVAALKVQHVIVMGHYGCGGVAASIASPPSGDTSAAIVAVQNWIKPIRKVFQTSARKEIVELRKKIKNKPNIPEPAFEDPGFRALVEENVKVGVRAVAQSKVVKDSYDLLQGTTVGKVARTSEGESQAVFIHGWVYDISTGLVKDLNVTVSPPGIAFRSAPTIAVIAAQKRADSEHIH